jgi:cation:H+ antiporter
MQLFFFLSGLVLLIIGAEALVRGASRLGRVVGLSPLIIGLTIVAFGTSAPEMAVSVMAGLSGNADISLGNIVGSNIFNIMAVLGMSAAVAAKGISISDVALRFDIPIMTTVAVACLPIFSRATAFPAGKGSFSSATTWHTPYT